MIYSEMNLPKAHLAYAQGDRFFRAAHSGMKSKISEKNLPYKHNLDF